MSVIERVEFKLAYNESAGHRFNHYARKTTAKEVGIITDSVKLNSHINARTNKIIQVHEVCEIVLYLVNSHNQNVSIYYLFEDIYFEFEDQGNPIFFIALQESNQV